jgi:hypothetical protein
VESTNAIENPVHSRTEKPSYGMARIPSRENESAFKNPTALISIYTPNPYYREIW